MIGGTGARKSVRQSAAVMAHSSASASGTAIYPVYGKGPTMTTAASANGTQEIVKSARLSDEALSELKTHEDALRMLQEAGAVAEDFAADYGSGFDQVEKSTLVGVPLFIVEWRDVKSDKVVSGGEFVVVFAITQDDKKVMFIDGSSGIYEQLKHVTEMRERKGEIPADQIRRALIIKKGLRVSNYVTQVADGKGVMRDTNASTYYLAN